MMLLRVDYARAGAIETKLVSTFVTSRVAREVQPAVLSALFQPREELQGCAEIIYETLRRLDASIPQRYSNIVLYIILLFFYFSLGESATEIFTSYEPL